METSGTWNDMDTQCRQEGTASATTRLAVFESRRENDCMVKYIVDEFRSTSTRNYAIGLRVDDRYTGVYEWAHVDNSQPGSLDSATPAFTNWAPGKPTGNDCVYMSVGVNHKANGLWIDKLATPLFMESVRGLKYI